MEDIFTDAGRDILDSVTKAIETNNYTNLGNDIRNTVSHATMDVRKNVAGHTATHTTNSVFTTPPRTNTPPMVQPQAAPQAAPPVRNHTYTTTFTNGRTPFMPRVISRVGNIAKAIIGGVGATGLGIGVISTIALGIALHFPIGTLITLGILGVLFLIFVGLLHSGIKGDKLLTRYRNYNAVVGDKEYITIEQLAKASGYSTSKVLADIKRLHMKNYIPYACFDKDRTTLMLTDKVYKDYVKMESNRVASAKEADLAAKEAGQSKLPADVQQLLTDGNAYLRKVRDYNDQIPDDQEMSNKLYELESIMKRIFDKVKSEPKSAKELRRFMDYYLPTTEKLLGAYVDIQRQGGDGENVRTAKHEIEDAMDVINQAFASLLDQMFQRTAWDVSSDISVMKTMMAQDGLTEDAMAEVHE